MFERYDPSKKPVKTIGLDGDIYDSGLEARFAYTLSANDIKYGHNDLAIMLDIQGGQYKPDFHWHREDDKIVIAEVKGWMSERAEAAADAIRELCDNPASPIEEFVYAWSKGMTLYKNHREAEASFYVCPNCGKVSVQWDDHQCCDRCGAQDHTKLCTDFNGWANEDWEKHWSVTWNARIKREGWDANAVQKYRDFAAKHKSLDLVEGKLVVLTSAIAPGQWKPDFMYTEQPCNRDRYRTALAPIAVVVVSSAPTHKEKQAHDELIGYVKSSDSPIVKFALVDRDGIHVADYYTQGRIEDGHWYECHSCGQVFVASEKHHQCPCCDSTKTEQVSKGKEENHD